MEYFPMNSRVIYVEVIFTIGLINSALGNPALKDKQKNTFLWEWHVDAAYCLYCLVTQNLVPETLTVLN